MLEFPWRLSSRHGGPFHGRSLAAAFSGPVTVFQEQPLPERATPVGYAALIDAFGLTVPRPRTLSGIGEHHRLRTEAGWRLLTPRHAPAPALDGHLTFALKYEGLDLAVLKRLSAATGPKPIEALVRARPKGSYARRLWFLYEWLMGERLDLADAAKSDYVPVVSPEQQWAGTGAPSPRHRVRNNLPGTPAFCPLVLRTKLLEEFAAMDLAGRAQLVVAAVPRDLLARTAAFLLLKDSNSSYAIEGERAPQDRIQRWGRAIGAAGRHNVTLEELLRLQRIVIGDARFVRLGLRREGGFIGEHDRESRLPLPDHISAAPADLPSHCGHGGLRRFLRPGARWRHRGRGAGLRVRLRPPVCRWQRSRSPLSDPPCARPPRLQPGRRGLSGLGGGRSGELVLRAQRADHSEFAELMQLTAGASMRLAAAMLKNHHLAEEELQNAYFKAWHQFQGGSLFSTWMSRIVVNQCLMHLRKNRRSKFISIQGATDSDGNVRSLDLPDRGTNAEALVCVESQAVVLSQEIGKLPATLRYALVLRDVKELSTGGSSGQPRNFGCGTEIPAAAGRVELRRRMVSRPQRQSQSVSG